jgi:hypothetical protein
MDASKQCLTATFNIAPPSLRLKDDECVDNSAKAICEVFEIS